MSAALYVSSETDVCSVQVFVPKEELSLDVIKQYRVVRLAWCLQAWPSLFFAAGALSTGLASLFAASCRRSALLQTERVSAHFVQPVRIPSVGCMQFSAMAWAHQQRLPDSSRHAVRRRVQSRWTRSRCCGR